MNLQTIHYLLDMIVCHSLGCRVILEAAAFGQSALDAE